jgi:hypothetical protein
MTLSADATHLLEILPPSGRITNQTGVKITGWDYERLVAAKFELRNAGLIEIKKGWGGPFGRLPTSASVGPPPTSAQAGSESELYLPLADWIRGEFLPDDFDSEKDLFEVTVSANKRPASVGIFEVPDIISLSLKKYRYVPTVHMEVVSFEVKRAADAFSAYGIFEAISHSKFAHRSYYCFEWLDEAFEKRADYQRIEQEATAHGIGLLRCRFVDDQKKDVHVDELLEGRYLDPQPSVLNSLIDSFFEERVKKRIVERTGYNMFW